MAKFEIGKIVELKSGGPDMTAGSTDDIGYVDCAWFEGTTVKRASFHEDQLDLSED